MAQYYGYIMLCYPRQVPKTSVFEITKLHFKTKKVFIANRFLVPVVVYHPTNSIPNAEFAHLHYAHQGELKCKINVLKLVVVCLIIALISNNGRGGQRAMCETTKQKWGFHLVIVIAIIMWM